MSDETQENGSSWSSCSLEETSFFKKKKEKQTRDAEDDGGIEFAKKYVQDKLRKTVGSLRKGELREAKLLAIQKADGIAERKIDDVHILSGYGKEIRPSEVSFAEDAVNKKLFSQTDEKGRPGCNFTSALHVPFATEEKQNKAISFSCLTESVALYMQNEEEETEEKKKLVEKYRESAGVSQQALVLQELMRASMNSKIGIGKVKDNSSVIKDIMRQCTEKTSGMFAEFMRDVEEAFEHVQLIPVCADVDSIGKHELKLEAQMSELLEKEPSREVYIEALAIYLSVKMLCKNFFDSGTYSGKKKTQSTNSLKEWHMEGFTLEFKGELNKEERGKLAVAGEEYKERLISREFAPGNMRDIAMLGDEVSRVANLRTDPEYDYRVGCEITHNCAMVKYENWHEWRVRAVLLAHRFSAHILEPEDSAHKQLIKALYALPVCKYKNFDQLRTYLHTNGFGILRSVPIHGGASLKALPLKKGYLKGPASVPRLVWETPTAVHGKKVAFVRLNSTTADLCIGELPSCKQHRLVIPDVWACSENAEQFKNGYCGRTITGIALHGEWVVWVSDSNILCWAYVKLCKGTGFHTYTKFGFCRTRTIVSCGFSKDGQKAWIGMTNGLLHVMRCDPEKKTLIFERTYGCSSPDQVSRAVLTPKRVFIMCKGQMNIFDSRKENSTVSVYNFGECADFDIRGQRIVFQRDDHTVVYVIGEKEDVITKEDNAVRDYKPGLFRPLVYCNYRNIATWREGTVWSVPMPRRNKGNGGWGLFRMKMH